MLQTCALLAFSAAGLALQAQDGPPEILSDLHRDIVKLDPQHYKVDSENEYVRVVRVSLKANETSPIHDDPPGIIVCQKECHIRFTRPNGRVQDVHLADAQTRLVYDESRSETNLSTKPTEFLFIELKKSK